MEELAGFVDGAPILDETSATVARELFLRFFVPNGLPRLVVVDAGSAFAGLVAAVCKILCVLVSTGSPGNHRAIRVERFFRYLNKVEIIVCADA